MEETREKIELFRNYYLVCFRSFDQDPYSPTYLEPLNMYIIVFREGTLSVSESGLQTSKARETTSMHSSLMLLAYLYSSIFVAHLILRTFDAGSSS